MADKFEINVVDQAFKVGLEENYINSVRTQMQHLLVDARKAIVQRTKSGRDSSGRSFAPYTEKYAKFKAGKGLPINPVDLTLSGRMLNSIETETRRQRAGSRSDIISAKIRVNDNLGKVEGVSKKRPFLGIDKEFEQLFQKLADSLSINKANK